MSEQALWSAAEAIAATRGRCAVAWSASGVSIDSRDVARGDLFVALVGPNHDGHDYVAAALQAGAAAALVHRVPEGLSEAAPLLLVEDTLLGLTALGSAARDRSQARFVGVTGSVGKTGTKEALKACLSVQAPTAASAASHNNHWGVPLSLARMPRNAVYGIFEMGMNHPGEIRILSHMVRPDVALITNVAPVHLEYFKSVLEIADAKAEIFEGMDTNGVAVLNRDNPLYANLIERAESEGVTRIISFGRHPDAAVRLLDQSLHATCSAVRASVKGEIIDYCISLPGEHWVINSLAVLATVKALGADVPTAAAQLAKLTPLKGRGEKHDVILPGGVFRLIDDSYNANPTSMRAAIEVLGRAETRDGGRRIAVLGDMLELGPAADRLHAGLASSIVGCGIDLVFTCGQHMAALHDALPAAKRGAHVPDSRSLATLIQGAVRPDDVVLVKGSLGSRMALVVEALKAVEQAPLRAANGE